MRKVTRVTAQTSALAFCGSVALLSSLGCSGAAAASTGVTSVQGSVLLGPLSGSTVAAYALSQDPHTSPAVALTTTDSTGGFKLPRQPFLVQVSGGTYREEATGEVMQFAGHTLRAAYTTVPDNVIVSALSEAMVEGAEGEGGLTAASLDASRQTISLFLGNVDPVSTLPATVAAGATVMSPTSGNWMSFALGVESQLRTEFGMDHDAAMRSILKQAETGNTYNECDGGAGNVNEDGTLGATNGESCAFMLAAKHFAANPLNTSGITSVPAIVPTIASGAESASASAASCGDRVTLLQQNFDLFEHRRNDVQAQLGGGVTIGNWPMTDLKGTWGPSKSLYGSILTPAACTDVDQFQRELVLAVENYWIDRGLNYCHHHVPGWLPPDDSLLKKPVFRNSSSGSTSGGSKKKDPMTCTSQRSVTGAQQSSTSSLYGPADIQWQGMDCSNFTAWVYDFAGVTTSQLSGQIKAQSCATDAGTPGVLLDINSANIASMLHFLQPGDLLLVTQVATVDSRPVKQGEAAYYDAAHVITWTGKRWSDLQNGPDREHYDLSRLGQPGSRLGGDLSQKYLGYDPALLGSDAAHDPWMIIDSHFAGPAYRPFVPADSAHAIRANWYANDLSAVRRIIGSGEVLQAGNPLNAYVMSTLSGSKDSLQVIASPQSNATFTSGQRLIYKVGSETSECLRVVVN